MAHFITGASKAMFEYATVWPQEALTGQQDGDMAASSAHSPPGLCGRCPLPLVQLCQEDLSSFLAFFSRALLFRVCDTVFSKAVFIIVFIVNDINFISAGRARQIFLYLPGRRLKSNIWKIKDRMLTTSIDRFEVLNI